ncbi:flagellar filament capping protein FliD [Synergistaceae bacterium OttesenSCG-928-I11]|nr:flagellar filament capping protein FliD [Synergistaceae bacterium OttesenSCG-928-I11]
MTSPNSVLAGLGITTIKDDPNDSSKQIWEFPEDRYTEAKDAILTLNGVKVTRSSNTIPNEDDESDALIANVKLELVGEGDVTMNITQDATEVIENLQKFIDSYNDLMELINYRLEEKYDSNTQSDDDDYLQSILSANKGSTTFGVLHGDQLLWSVKNQMRRYFSESIPSLSTDLRSRKFLHPASEIGAQGSFYINIGAKVARIDVSATDSLEDIRRKLNSATTISTDSVDSEGVISSSKKELGLDVEIVDGQLVIKPASTVSGTGSENHTVKRNSGQAYDQLAFVPNTSAPVNGVLTVYSGSTEYEEGVDYKLETVENAQGILESHIVWLGTGKAPSSGTYQIKYEYEAAAIGLTMIPSTSSTESLSALDLHYDSSKIQLSNLGFTTESTNYGKSGLMEFDQDKFFEAIKEDPDMVSNVMLAFMDKMETYIGNLVDSSNILVAGNIVTKGRFAAALNSIDSEVSSLNEQITKLEKQLQAKQTALYKQYSDMEQAIQKMNAQMSSMSQYFSNQSSK